MRKSVSALTLMLILTVGLTLSTAGRSTAQNLFEPLIKVNGDVITRYELQQRERLLTLLRAPANPAKLAREQLIDDRLKMQAARAQGITVNDEMLAAGMEQFAAQGKLNTAQMIGLLEKGGVSEQTFRDFVLAGLTWRELTRAKFGAGISVSEEDLERARAAISTGTGVRVLLSEIIIPFTPQTEQQVIEVARQISELTSEGAFSAQAQKYSVTPTRANGGRLPWTPITKLPPVLRPLILGLAPGEVTDPLPLEGAVAMFQMRGIEETDVPTPEYSAIEYAAYYIDGGRSEQALKRAAQIEADTDTCDDLYGIAKGQPESVLERGTKAPGEIPQDIAIELSRLDPGEVSYSLTRSGGQTLVLLMMCGRVQAMTEDATAQAATPGEDGEEAAAPDQNAVLAQQISNQRLESFADGYIAQLRSEARIIEK